MEPKDQVDLKAIRDEASLWLARLDSGSADLEAFNRWRDADPAHAAAIAKLSGLWSKIGAAKQAVEPELSPEIQEARSRRGFLRAAGIAGGVVLAGLGAYATKSFAKSTASTQPGERRRVIIDGGTAVELNTDSKISWRTENGQPCVWLERGEAAVTVSDTQGRCTLKAGGMTADLGTGEFNARLRGGSLDLLALRGRGTVQASDQPQAQPARFEGGQTVLATASRTFVQAASTESFDEAAAWRRGEIVFQGAPLGAVVEDYNRYLTRKLVIADPELNKLRLGGRFTNSDPAEFLATLQSGFGVRAVDGGDNTIMLTRSE